MKKILMLAMCIVMLMTGCGSEKENSNSVGENDESKETTNDSNLDVCYADILPNTEDYFSNGKITIIDQDGGEQYLFRITNYQDGEYEAYVEACKNIGFSDVTYEGENDGGKMFFAYTEDGEYYLEVMLGKQIEAIDVCCKTSTEDKADEGTVKN